MAKVQVQQEQVEPSYAIHATGLVEYERRLRGGAREHAIFDVLWMERAQLERSTWMKQNWWGGGHHHSGEMEQRVDDEDLCDGFDRGFAEL